MKKSVKGSAPVIAENQIAPEKKKKGVAKKTRDMIRETSKEKEKPEKAKNSQEEVKNTRARIFKNVDYNAPRSEQKNKRESVRRGLFKILSPYMQKKRAGTLKKDQASAIFEEFKKYVTSEYNVPLENVEELFKGNEEGQTALKDFAPDFKAYLKKSE